MNIVEGLPRGFGGRLETTSWREAFSETRRRPSRLAARSSPSGVPRGLFRCLGMTGCLLKFVGALGDQVSKSHENNDKEREK